MRIIRGAPLAIALALLASSASAQATAGAALNRLTPAETSAGWRLLFDGRTFEGWRTFRKTGVGPRLANRRRRSGLRRARAG